MPPQLEAHSPRLSEASIEKVIWIEWPMRFWAGRESPTSVWRVASLAAQRQPTREPRRRPEFTVETVSHGQRLEKGQELGYFSYGGSSMCLVFQPGAIQEFTMGTPPPKPIVDPASGPAVKVNGQIAIARGR